MDNNEDDEMPKSRMVKLVSSEGHEFYCDRRCAMVSGTINAMLSGQFAESRGEVTFPEISSAILEKIIQYCYYKVRYTNSTSRIPDFPIEPEIALELLMAANFLDC
uniref:Elongin-C n=1 Tax=Fibrocapsa japonica TaxID=94617 RepID=A0A7S2XYA0_9STRA|mmetsp:Transcript_24379/g.35454  ORF Transcript_24379/g.35454 Transcript_24379/m.35454 type:complete len:106 (+) Transcript_24379:105-422(+)|eukprot:CAMPEP_0113943034 /NCGR_PEP_ID=MMETSP1339-20121228/16834_1 /TAXON_ID=94617 /ORGANISM="Fibrocapsa japonica" /LENGTH=105 /DNA_ID=CAMNT_0000947769 /DNA_START=88 /DNA_END=405 /DNA_ORIENTATION=+ /assembly_acc=CAM_ASM_000762